jgi:NADH-quinone oxidoreductase subunit L
MLFFGRSIDPDPEKPSRFPGLLSTVLVAASFAVALGCSVQAWNLPGHRFQQHGPVWFARAEWGLLLDFLSIVLMLLVAGIGTLVHVYSTAYMSHDGELYRFFGGLSFFVAMMQILVLSNKSSADSDGNARDKPSSHERNFHLKRGAATCAALI